jgi:hypothetical protein
VEIQGAFCRAHFIFFRSSFSLKVSDGSVTTRLLSPFWTWLASFIPASIAPNVITLAGFICQLLAFWVSDPSIVQWIGGKTSAVSAAVFTYAYMTLDALDGKHARNTAQSGALRPTPPTFLF